MKTDIRHIGIILSVSISPIDLHGYIMVFCIGIPKTFLASTVPEIWRKSQNSKSRSLPNFQFSLLEPLVTVGMPNLKFIASTVPEISNCGISLMPVPCGVSSCGIWAW